MTFPMSLNPMKNERNPQKPITDYCFHPSIQEVFGKQPIFTETTLQKRY